MRTIKFRQYNKEQNRWHYWGFVSKGQFVNPVDNPDGDWSESYQFTGLTDKNGKEIFEGDIVRLSDSNDSTVFGKDTGVVEFMEGRARFYLNTGDFNDWTELNKEVIGNIWENPELLEK